MFLWLGRHLVQVGQAVGVLAQGLVLASQPVAGRNLTKLLQIHNVEGAAREEGQKQVRGRQLAQEGNSRDVNKKIKK